VPINWANFFSNVGTIPDADCILHHILLFVVLRIESMTLSSQYGQSGQLSFFLTGSPPKIASLLALLAIFAYAGIVLEATAARDPADAAAMNCRLVKSLLPISAPFHLAFFPNMTLGRRFHCNLPPCPMLAEKPLQVCLGFRV
jgi:hypothetical protein